MNDLVRVTGTVRITIIEADGRQELIEIKNLVMREAKTILAKLLANDAAYANAYIDRISFGTSDVAAADDQTGLQGTVATPAAAITITYPAYNSVKFTTILLGTEGGTATYQELGLFAVDEKMFSRVVIAPIVKSADRQIQVDWTISFQ